MTFKDRLASLGFQSYDDYLRGPHWQGFKQKYRASGKSMRCAVCHLAKIQLHHHEYGRLGRERLDDVTPLCRDHHVKVHDRLKDKKWFVDKTDKIVAELRKEYFGSSEGMPTGKPSKKQIRRQLHIQQQEAQLLAKKNKKAKKKDRWVIKDDDEFLALEKEFYSLRERGLTHQLVPANYSPEMYKLKWFVNLLKRDKPGKVQRKEERRAEFYRWRNRAAPKQKQVTHDWDDPMTALKAVAGGFRKPRAKT